MLRYASRRQSKVARRSRDTRRVRCSSWSGLPARLAQPLLHLDPTIAPTLRHAGTLLLILGFGWLLISLVSVLNEYLHGHLLSGVQDDRRAKRTLTRVGIVDRALSVLVWS